MLTGGDADVVSMSAIVSVDTQNVVSKAVKNGIDIVRPDKEPIVVRRRSRGGDHHGVQHSQGGALTALYTRWSPRLEEAAKAAVHCLAVVVS